MPSKLIEKRNELKAKQDKLHEVLKQMGDNLDLSKVTVLTGTNEEKAASIKTMNKELTDIGAECDSLAEIEKASDADRIRLMAAEEAARKGLPIAKLPEGVEGKSLGELFTASDAYTKRSGTRGPEAELPGVDLKTLFSTGAGWAPQNIRTGKVVEYATRPIQIIDIVPGGTTSQAAIVYMEETTFTNNAAEATEGSGIYGEAALALTERTSTVRKIAVWLPVTQEQLEDVEGIQSYLNNRLTFMLRQRLDGQILVGNGTPPNLMGITNTVGIQTFARGAGGQPTDQFDAVYRAAKLVRVTGRAIPNVVVFHPNDWEDLRLMRSNDGIYILGNPNDPGPARIWGLPVVEADAITENTTLVGDFANFVQMFEKRGIVVEITDSHDTYFIYGKMAIRATVRVALPVYRPVAFCAITSM